MKVIFTIASLFFVAGCGAQGDPTPLPGQDQAVQLIWTVYGQTKAPPPIYWRRDSCSEPNGIYGVLPWCTFESDDGKVAGIERDYYVEVGAPSPGFKISDTALVHELLHAALGGDPSHTSPDWQTMIPAASAALKDAGL